MIHSVRPGDDIQSVLDHAQAYDIIEFEPGLYRVPWNKERNCALYISQPFLTLRGRDGGRWYVEAGGKDDYKEATDGPEASQSPAG